MCQNAYGIYKTVTFFFNLSKNEPESCKRTDFFFFNAEKGLFFMDLDVF